MFVFQGLNTNKVERIVNEKLNLNNFSCRVTYISYKSSEDFRYLFYISSLNFHYNFVYEFTPQDYLLNNKATLYNLELKREDTLEKMLGEKILQDFFHTWVNMAFEY